MRKNKLVTWKLVYTRQAQQDAKKLTAVGLKDKAITILEKPERNPHETPPPYQRLRGDLEGACSRRISVQHRLVYQVLEKGGIVKVIRLWTHYE
jgi:toxin YoeB